MLPFDNVLCNTLIKCSTYKTMHHTVSLDINPSILRWAREESGYSISEVIHKLDIQKDIYIEWEKTGSSIPFNVLKNVAKIYKRQIAVFFLTNTPHKTKKPTDYRNTDLLGSKLSLKTLLAFRRVDKFRDFLLEYNSSEYYQDRYNWLLKYDSLFYNMSLSNEDSTLWLREILNYSLDNQINDDSIEISYNNWRNAFENNLGIYTFQFSLPPSEIQGFCYSDNFPFCIAVNNKYPVSSRIFTLFHELGHIIKRQSGLCIPNNINNTESIELECNSFAGKVLLPDNVIVPALNKDEIYKRARKLKVSSEVYLRRIKSLELISNDDFFRILEDIHRSIKPSRGFGFSTPLQKSMNSKGQALFNSVIDALNKNKISYSHASDILELKVNYLIKS